MSKQERRLLDREELNKLFELTNPQLSPKPQMHIVIRNPDSEWRVEDSHFLRGYRACKRSLASKVSIYESNGAWPNQCEIGIGIFKDDIVISVLVAKNLGVMPVHSNTTSLPLDDILNAVGLTRSEVK